MTTPALSELQQKMQAVLQDFRQHKALSKWADVAYQGLQDRFMALLGKMDGGFRHIRLPDRDVWLSYKPSIATIKTPSDGSDWVVEGRGEVYLHVCTDLGQVWHGRIGEYEPHDILTVSDAVAIRVVQSLLSKDLAFNLLQGDVLNTIAPRESKPGDPSWALRLNRQWAAEIPNAEGDSSINMAFHEIVDGLSSSRPEVEILSSPLHAGAEFSLHVSRFASEDLFHVLQGQRVNTRAMFDFHDALNLSFHQGTKLAHLESLKRQSDRLVRAGVHIDENTPIGRMMSVLSVKNYIAEAETDKARLYRAQFVMQSLSLMFGNDDKRISSVKVDKALRELFARNQMLNIPDGRKRHDTYGARQELVSLIDQGVYPSAELAAGWGVPHLSKNQFGRAMHMQGAYMLATENSRCFTFMYNRLNSSFSKNSMMALNQLPQEWFSWDAAAGINVLSTDGVLALEQQVGAGYFGDNGEQLTEPMSVMQKALPFLIETGKALDRLRGEQLQCRADGVDDSSIKAQIKALSTQWRWMTSGPGSLGDRLSDFDQKYKVIASYEDYPEILKQLWSAVYFRVLFDHDHIPHEVSFKFEEDSYHGGTGVLFWDDESIHQSMMNYLDEQAVARGDEQMPSELYPQAQSPGADEIAYTIASGQTDFRSSVRLNDELHKVYSTFLRDANAGSNVNTHWEPMLLEPAKLDGFELHSINDRVSLLAEGTEMQHCVFSYLQRCMAGESVILSAREPVSGDRLATIELSLDTRNSRDDSSLVVSLKQCYGFRNSSEGRIGAVRAAVESWVSDVNMGRVKTNGLEVLRNKSQLQSVMRDIATDPAKKGAQIQSIPYTEDGVFLAYYMFNRYTPEHMSIEKMLSATPAVEQVYRHSQFHRDIQTIESIAKKFNCPAEDVVRQKMRSKVPAWADVEHLMGVQRHVGVVMSDVLGQYGNSLTAAQKFTRSQDEAKRSFLTFPTGYTASHFERDLGAGVNWWEFLEVQHSHRGEKPLLAPSVEEPQSGIRLRA